MLVRLTPSGKKRLELIRQLASPMNGFVIGKTLGKYTIIKDLVPIPFDSISFENIYKEMFQMVHLDLLGVFFFKKTPFENEWMYQDLVLTIKQNTLEITWCHIPGL